MNKEEAKTLLPWFAADALDADEIRAVEAHLQASPELRRELAEIRVLQRTVGTIADGEPVFRPALINDALRQIDEYEATRPAPDSSSPITKAVDWLRETLADGWVHAPAGARVAIVAQFALILVLGGILLTSPDTGTNGDQVYSTTAARPMDSPAATGSMLIVVFQPTVTEQQIRQLLTDIGARIVAGPSAQGSYTILLPTTSEEGTMQALGALRAHPDTVRFATQSE